MTNKFNERVKLYNREDKNRLKKSVVIDKDANEMINRFRDNIDNVKSKFELYEILIKQNNKQADDLLRLQIVYLMSALDYFMHELYSYSLIKIFNNQKRKTYRYKEYKVPIKLVEKALYDSENIGKYLKDTIIEINSNFTFMHPNKIREVLNIISTEDEFALVENNLKNKNILKINEKLEDILEQIYIRRNRISHQTDFEHGKSEKNKINQKDVERYIYVVEQMVEQLFSIVCIS